MVSAYSSEGQQRRCIGVISEHTNRGYPRAKVLAMKNEGKGWRMLSEGERERGFPHSGLVFFPVSGNTDMLAHGNVLEFECNKNEEDDGERNFDHFIVKPETIREHSCYPVLNRRTEWLYNLYPGDDELPKDFYINDVDREEIIGPVKSVGGVIKAGRGKEVSVYNASDLKNIFVHNDDLFDGFLLERPQKTVTPVSKIDMMTPKQLVDWFRDRVISISPEAWKQLLKVFPEWKHRFDEMVRNSSEIPDGDTFEKALLQERYGRLLKIQDQIELDKESIEKITCFSAVVQKSFEKEKTAWIEVLNKDMKQERENFELYKRETENGFLEQMEELERAQKNYDQKEKDQKARELAFNEKRKSLEMLQKHLEEKRDDIVKSAAILSGNCFLENLNLRRSAQERKSYVVESYFQKNPDEEEPVECAERFLRKSRESDEAKKLMGKFLKFKKDKVGKPACLKILDIRDGLAFSKVFEKNRYVVQNVLPDWMRFADCWDNGLGELWESAQQEKDVMHILMLEEANMALPNCWGQPLWDVLRGVRAQIPYASIGKWPENFWIFITLAPSEVGLPVSEEISSLWEYFDNEKN